MTNIQAIRDFFQREDKISPKGGRKVEMSEMKNLSREERAELGALCAAELGETITPVN